jgi:Fe-S-cluster containining protein
MICPNGWSVKRKRQGINWAEQCRGCGACCVAFPLPDELIAKYRDRVRVPTHFHPVDQGHSMPLTADHFCPFLCRQTKRCLVYADRPDVCRMYGEIEEMPCQKLDRHGAELAYDELCRRYARRVGVTLSDD